MGWARAVAVFGLLMLACPTGTEGFTRSYERKLEKKQYKKALLELNKTIRLSDTVAPPILADALVEKARFYERYVGDYAHALAILTQVRALPGIRQDQASESKDGIFRLDDLLKSNSAQGRLLRELDRRGKITNQQIASITSALIEKPTGPYLAHLSYYLGMARLQQDANLRARDAFRAALRARPAMDLMLPASEGLQKAERRWHWDLGTGLAWGSAFLLFVVFSPLFYMARPWKRLGLRHLVALIAVVLAWAVSYELFARALGGAVEVEALRRGATIISALPDYDIFDLLDGLYLYGMVAVVGAFVIVIALERVKLARLRVLLNVVFCLALSASITGIFYMRYCFDAQTRGEKGAGALGTYFSFETSNPSAQVMSNPAAFMGMKVEKLDEPPKKAFIERHYQRALEKGAP